VPDGLADFAFVAVRGGGVDEPVASAVRTACAVMSGGVWNTPKPSAGIWTPLFRVTFMVMG
jgi:hypothetical protein